jgi:ribosome-associated protein
LSVIPEGEYALSYVRSPGPGGQNVNKVASAVQLRFDLAGTEVLNERVKTRMRALAGQRLNEDGSVLLIARRHRTQEQNRRDAHERLADLIRRALVEPKVRHATRPTRAAKERRLESKRTRKSVKRLRGRVGFDD